LSGNAEESMPVDRAGRRSRSGGRVWIERRLDRHSDLVALIIVLVGFAIRIGSSQGVYLSEDEALHFQLSNVAGVGDVYRSSLTSAHPPFFFLLLHFWRRIGNSENVLRLLPALFGAAFLWVAYRWIMDVFGKSAAFFALILLAFSPATVSLSASVRGYSLLLLLMVSALAVLERAIELRSPSLMACFSGLLYLAILTHYSALWFTLSVFVYVLVRARTGRWPAVFVRTWLGFQAAAAVLYSFLYFSHLSNLRGGELEQDATGRWLREGYFATGRDSPLAFVAKQTFGVFKFLLGSPVAGFVGLVMGVAGIAVLASKRRPTAIVLALPFGLGATAALIGVYPYGGTRHSAYLLLFAAAAMGVTGAIVTGARLWPSLLLTAALIPVSWSTIPTSQDRTRMSAAIERLRFAAARGSVLFADNRTGALLSYYLGKDDFNRLIPGRGRFWESRVGNYRLIGSPIWSFDERTFVPELRRLIQEYRLPTGQVLWVVQIGSEYSPAFELSREYPAAVVPQTFRLEEISAVEMRVP
jgi:hypothetical protein